MAGRKSQQDKPFDGIQSMAEMLNVMDIQTREKLLERLYRENPEITEKIKQRMFVFEDLLRLPDRGMQILLREVPPAELLLALRNASEDFKAKVFKNMSNTAFQILKDEMVNQKPQRLSKVTASQQGIIKIAKKLIREGRIRLD